jgi:flagellar hook protein FlgE
MMRSLYSGVSGLQNHQTRMDVIGNNVANVNTIGFKKGRVIFQDMISQGMRGAARPTEELGGVNPMQVGLGMTVATIDTIHTQGSLQSTGNSTDLAIQGNGFFILSQGDKEFYSRAGAFGLDEGGMLVNPANGMRVQGWEAETLEGQTYLNTASDTKDLFIPIGSKDPASATSEVELACNLDKRTPEVLPGAGTADIREGTWTIDKDIYDSFGNVHKMTINFTKATGVNNQWNVSVNVDETGENPTNTTLDIGAQNNADGTFTMEFDNLGALTSAFDAQGDAITEGNLLIPVSFDLLDSTPGADGAPIRQTLNLNLGEVGSYTNSVTQFAETSSTKAFRQNGYSMG